jgi:dihydroorotate dehydrogenase (NAD+) catalytic subunit
LLHTGYPNPGLTAALQRFAPAWSRSSLPVIVHLLAQNPDEVAHMLRRLEGKEGVQGIELSLPPDIEMEAARGLVQAALGEIVLIVRLPMEQALELAPFVIAAGAAAVSLGPVRGALTDGTGKVVEGRLYGPSVFPLALQVTRQLARLNLPVIAAGGVYTEQNIRQLLDASAAAVQLDASLWL